MVRSTVAYCTHALLLVADARYLELKAKHCRIMRERALRLWDEVTCARTPA